MLLSKIQDDLKAALKNQDDLTILTLRFLLAAIKNKEIELKKRNQLSEKEIIAVIKKQAKQRRESIEAFQKAARDDLADKETKELKILSKYLPREMSPKKLAEIVDQVIQEAEPSSPKDFGKLMGLVMAKTKGQAEGKQVAELVRAKLS